MDLGKKSRYSIGAVGCGLIVTLLTGIIENAPKASIIGARYYGFPLVWRVTMTLQPDQFWLANLAINTVVWMVASLIAIGIIDLLARRPQS